MNIAYVFLLVLLAQSVAVQAEDFLQLRTVAEKEELVVEANGERKRSLVPAATVVPGEEIVYTISFTNTGDAPAENVVITDPLPAEMSYVPDSAFGPGADVVFSVDDGVTWGRPNELTVPGEDGERRRAQPEDYTHIRWTLRHALAPGSRSFARFRAVLR